MKYSEIDEEEKTTMLQFYMMDDLKSALSTHSDFLLKTQWDAAGEIQDKVFDDWMMDTKSKRVNLKMHRTRPARILPEVHWNLLGSN